MPPELRQRRAAAQDHDSSDDSNDNKNVSQSPKLTPSQRAEAEDSSFSLLDVARIIVFLLLLSGATSYFVTRESFSWGLSRPSWTRPDVIKAWMVWILFYVLNTTLSSSL
jgi:hypothetical protein